MAETSPNSSPIDPPSNAESPSALPRKKYVKAVGPRLRIVLVIVFVLMALIGANSAYLASITGLEFLTGNAYQDGFYLWMFFGHVVLGFLLITPFLAFGVVHLMNTRHRKNRRAVRAGYALFTACVLVLVTGVLLVRIDGFFDLKDPPWARSLVYWAHAAIPVVAGWLYWLHRLAGPRIRWKVARVYGGLVGGLVVLMVVVHAQDPRQWNSKAPEDDRYFFPSLVRTTTENFIPAEKLMNDQYCVKCHADIHAGWKDSVHHFSSFNNPTYLASVRETRDVLLKRDGNVQASRWCAGCHDPVPFLSGAFDDPNFDDVKHPTAHAGVTCTVCHSIVEVPEHGPIGNADYVIDEPIHYPFATSENVFLQWINNQLIKAKPAFHKRTFMKPLHQTPEFCATCHKVHLPKALNHYKDFLRGQNHYDSYHLSGVSGHGARSFYYPPKAKQNCSACHMPLADSDDFGAKHFDDSATLKIHDHLFPTANTGIAWLRNKPKVVQAHQAFLKGVMRVDVFGIREGEQVDDPLTAPLRPRVSDASRPDVPTLKPGRPYVLDTVIRTLTMGHHFTQGTVDSNEVWLDVTVSSGDRIIGRSGGMNADRVVDPWSHFVNVFLLDKDGNRINRRNPQDIVVPLYNHQIPPGAGQTVHYGIILPDDLTAPVTVDVKLQYRKFDSEYMDFVTRSARPGDLPIRGRKPG
ncbi:MAG: multiheme c-type cytochrome, partial [Planctomycetota bacterium]|nr:multiheme c-type cytochrome [Planctomycetota bacterium]